MNRPPTARKRIPRLLAIHRKMSFEAFQRNIPHRPGWKHEYYGGKAHIRPSWTTVHFVLPLTERSSDAACQVRPVVQDDATALHDAFFDAFRFAPEYCDHPLASYRKRAAAYIEGFFGDKRGERSPASHVITNGNRILAAALVKQKPGKKPLLDCLLVRPECQRQGFATAVCVEVVNALSRAGYVELQSCAMLANDASLAWHTRFGFQELPDMWVAQARYRSAKYEQERLEQLGKLKVEQREELEREAARWWEEIQRLKDLPFDQQHPRLEE